MIITPAYRRLHAEIWSLHKTLTALDTLNDHAVSAINEAVERMDQLTFLSEGPEKVTFLMTGDLHAINEVISRLDAHPALTEAVEVLRELSGYPTSTTVFEQQVDELNADIKFGDNYGYDGVTVHGREVMDAHLRGLEVVHEDEMTERAFLALKHFLARFELYLDTSGVRENPFDADGIMDDYIRLVRIVGGS